VDILHTCGRARGHSVSTFLKIGWWTCGIVVHAIQHCWWPLAPPLAPPLSSPQISVSYLSRDSDILFTDWNDSQFNDYWPGWDAKLIESGVTDVTNISECSRIFALGGKLYFLEERVVSTAAKQKTIAVQSVFCGEA
jgi:hypothetical protein